MPELSVGFYSRLIFPRICNRQLNIPWLAQRRQELLTNAKGNILEIGFGTGLNLPHYPEHVRRLTIVEPNAGMNRLSEVRIENSGITVDQRTLRGENLPFEDGIFDCVVSTLTLCSIEGVNRALAEVYRVLKPAGQFLFLEHGLSPEPRVQKWQRRLNWLARRLGAGRRLDRNIKELVATPPFSSIVCDEFYMEKSPKTHGYMYRGIATK
jgi:ubiquinone/menaquinone biosynthesis C-methylase UbiE